MPITAPILPFSNFKWKWASNEPTEGLNCEAVYLGVLRAFLRNNRRPTSNPRLLRDLRAVQEETGTSVNLARSGERNLVRNSGQYWKLRGLIEQEKGIVILTPFGERVARGQITRSEFAATIIRTLTLPQDANYTRDERNQWQRAGLSVKPFELILGIIRSLGTDAGPQNAYLTTRELYSITVPLSGARADLRTHVEAILEYRRGILDLRLWPNCVPSANDQRIVREYLLFLEGFGIFIESGFKVQSIYDERYCIASSDLETAAQLLSVPVSSEISLSDISSSIRESAAVSNLERQRIIVTVLARPEQASFRRRVIRESRGSCLLSKESIPEALEAAHIIPVKNKGSDKLENGLCLRSDIHNLFDANHIRIAPDGSVSLSDLARASENYNRLPVRVEIPGFVNLQHLHWRIHYL